MWAQFVVTILWVSCVVAEFDYYDINMADDLFVVECGNSSFKTLIIRYAGDAFQVYAADDPTDCGATEVAPAVFLIDDARLNANCPYTDSATPELTTMEVVVQMASVRVIDDPAYLITCNYEFGGSQQSDSKDAIQGTVSKVPIWETAANKQATSNTSLLVYDTSANAITSTTLGDYIQMRAFMTQSGSEVSLKIWNCRGYAGDQSYYMLLGGCGEGDVVAANRGFHTRIPDPVQAGVDRVARSAYFHAFLLPGVSTIQFECDYIVCVDNSCDGRSCSLPARKKRSVEPSPGEELPKIVSEVITIRPRDHELKIATIDELIVDETHYEEPEDSLDTMTIALVAGMVSLAIVLVATTTCAVIYCRRQHAIELGYRQESLSSSYPRVFPTPSPEKMRRPIA